MEIGRAGGEEEKKRGMEGFNDHRETETDFPSSSWEILPMSLQPVRTVTHDYSPLLLLLLTVHTHADTHWASRSDSQLPPSLYKNTYYTLC